MQWHAIVAMDLRGGIGFEGKMPWHLSSELKHFKALTHSHAVIFGNTTFKQFKKALPDRDNLILSQSVNETDALQRQYYFSSRQELLNFCQQKNYSKIFVAGGTNTYQLFADLIECWHVSQIELEATQIDTYFPMSLLNTFKKVSEERHLDEKTQVAWRYQFWSK